MLNFNRFSLPSLVIGLTLVSPLLAVLLVAPQDGAQTGEFHGQPALVMANDKLELKVLSFGGALVSLRFKDDAEKMNPLWDSFRADIEEGRPIREGGSVGHFVCVDGFGPVSQEEREVGLPGHGEAQGDSEFLETGESSEPDTGRRYSYRESTKY